MPLPVIPDVYRVAFNWVNSADPRTASNVTHWLAPTLTAAALYTALDANVTADMWNTVYTNARVASVEITALDGTSGAIGFAPGAVAKWSGHGGTDYTPQVASIVKLTTGLRGPSHRGRLFLPWVPELSSSRGTLDPADVASSTAAWITFLNAMIADDAQLVVASYAHTSYENVVGVGTEATVATQRRRLKRP